MLKEREERGEGQKWCNPSLQLHFREVLNERDYKAPEG